MVSTPSVMFSINHLPTGRCLSHEDHQSCQWWHLEQIVWSYDVFDLYVPWESSNCSQGNIFAGYYRRIETKRDHSISSKFLKAIKSIDVFLSDSHSPLACSYPSQHLKWTLLFYRLHWEFWKWESISSFNLQLKLFLAQDLLVWKVISQSLEC